MNKEVARRAWIDHRGEAMSEDGKPFIPMNSTTKLATEDHQERNIERQKRLELVKLEISKIQVLPAAYWPNEWRKHLERLSICGLALIRLMALQEYPQCYLRTQGIAPKGVHQVTQRGIWVIGRISLPQQSVCQLKLVRIGHRTVKAPEP
jgi:hypothetical protein